MLNDRVLVYITAFSKTSSYQSLVLFNNFQLSFYLVTSCIALSCDNHLLHTHVSLVKKWLMGHTKMNPTEVTPSSPVLSQLFVVLTALTGCFYNKMFFLKKPPPQSLTYFRKVPKYFQISNVFKMPSELCNSCVKSAV